MSSIFPITVIAAIAIFLVKEILETVRRMRADGRKKRAIRTLLAAEVERNKWAVKSLRGLLKDIGEVLAEKGEIELRYDANGTPHIRTQIDVSWGQRPLPMVHKETLNKNLLELALVDKRLFEKALAATDAVSDLDHIRSSILNHVRARADDHSHDYLEGLVDYGTEVIDHAERELNALYQGCTGKALTRHRVR